MYDALEMLSAGASLAYSYILLGVGERFFNPCDDRLQDARLVGRWGKRPCCVFVEHVLIDGGLYGWRDQGRAIWKGQGRGVDLLEVLRC